MYVFITVLILIAAVCLILIVLVQNSKGGGLASSFASSNQIMGAPKTADFLEKATWTLAGIVIVLSIVAAAFLPNRNLGATSYTVHYHSECRASEMKKSLTKHLSF